MLQVRRMTSRRELMRGAAALLPFALASPKLKLRGSGSVGGSSIVPLFVYERLRNLLRARRT